MDGEVARFVFGESGIGDEFNKFDNGKRVKDDNVEVRAEVLNVNTEDPLDCWLDE